MYEYIKGKIVNASSGELVVDHLGIGYKIFCSLRTFSHFIKKKEEILIHTCFIVREDDHSLYGFSNLEEKQVFMAILKVSGIGPKLALKILTEIEPSNLISQIELEKLDSLKKIKGLGPKTAGKLILELKGKLAHILEKNTTSETENDVYRDTKEALSALGYKGSEIENVLKKVFSKEKELDLETAIKWTLAEISK